MISTDPDRWYYIGEHRSAYTDKLNPGDIVVIDRQPYRLDEIAPRPHVNWNERYLTAWEHSGRPDSATWWKRPFALVLTRIPPSADAKPPAAQHMEAPGHHYWTVLPEHFAVCRLCGELTPCTDVHNERIMTRVSAEFADAMRILPGFCHHCKGPINRRQGSMRFEGPNLIRPDLGENSAVFHTRQSGGCFSAAFDYDKRWAAAETGRRGKLSCAGSVTIHLDGTWECSLGPECAGETDVLGDSMRHRGGDSRCYRAFRDRNGRFVSGTDCWCTVTAAVPVAVEEAAG